MSDYIVLELFEGGHSNIFSSSFSFFVVVVIVLVILGSAAMQQAEKYLRKKDLIVTNCQKALDVV